MEQPLDIIKKLLDELTGARKLTPLELNDIRFSGRKTIITPKSFHRRSSN